MEHNRIVVIENARIENSRLSERYPVFKTGFGNNPLCLNLADCVVVINAYLNRVACSAPVNGRVAVAGLGDGAYIYYFDAVRVGLSLDRVNDILHSLYIDFLSL